jgi:hypothetical protein
VGCDQVPIDRVALLKQRVVEVEEECFDCHDSW